MTNNSFATSRSAQSRRFGPALPPRTFAGFAIAILAVILIAVFSYFSLESRTASVERTTHTLNVLRGLEKLFSSLKDAETGQRGYLLTGEESYLDPYHDARAVIFGEVESVRRLTADDSPQQERLRVLEQLATTKLDELKAVIELRRAGNVEAALAVVRTGRGKSSMDRIRDLVAQMSDEEQGLLVERTAQFQQAAAFSIFVTWGGSAVLLVLITSAAYMASRDVRAKEVQAWLQAGQTGLSEGMQGEQRLEVLGGNVLSFLARYVDAQVGAIYVAEAPGRFRRYAGFALAPGQDDAADVLRLGDGLVGQAARESRVLHVRDVPENYLPVASGLGRAPPAHLLLMPASVNGVVNAVVELGFFHTGDASDIALLQRVSESIAIAISSSKDRTRLEELLEETQRQSEEMQTQQEELRVTNEELEQQSTILRDSQTRLESQQAELEQTNVQLEEHTQMLARQNDELDTARNELLVKAAELERSNEFKSEFLANMSHELRTPLNSSLILAKLLADNPENNLTAEQVKFAGNIYAAGNDLLELINDILDLSKIEARQIDLSRDSVGVQQLVDNMTQTFRPISNQKGVAFEASVAEHSPASLSTDSQRLRQILRNLISNALKFTIKGRVHLRVFVPDPQHTGTDWIGFAVEDTGIGIAPEQQEIIFEPFRQADGTTNRRFGGTGLGLSISRQLAHMLGGRIELRSEAGVGSIFTLLLPQSMTLQSRPPDLSAASPLLPARVHAPTHSRKMAAARAAVETTGNPVEVAVKSDASRLLLIVEDDVDFANMLATLAADLRFECLIAFTADQGIELALRHKPTAILLDIHLPDHTGLSVLDRLKHDPSTRHIPVQVISGFDYSQTALQMGAANVLKKPVAREQLLAALSSLERKASHGERVVLIVEDNTLQRDSIQQLLQSEHVRAVAVASSSEALEQLRATSFDCMVLDLGLPDASGYELLEKMATDESCSFPPVIVYTARSLSTAEEQQLRRYSKSIIIKGAKSPERLLDEVTLFLHRIEASLPVEQQRMLRVARSRDSIFEERQILLVEDDVRNVFAITRVLEPHGAKLDIARNGREALAALERNPGIELVLMDIMMPQMDGMEAMRAIRAQRAFAKLPIIALTAKAMPDDRQRCLDAGANDYITKPIDIEKLLSLLRIWMPQRTGVAR